MKFSDYSIYQFCEKVYSLFEVPSDRTQIPLVDMYQFLEEKSNNFDLKSFEYLIQDIRNFHINIEFNTTNPAACPEIEIDQATGLQSTENKELRESHKYYLKHNFNDVISIFEYGISSLICIFDFKCKLKFTDKQTLRQKVELFHKALPSALFLHDLDSLLKFSDLAEKEYARIIESSKTTADNIIQLKLEENHTTNSVLQENPNIKQTEQAKLTFAHIALICIYQNILINSQNAENVIEEYHGKGESRKLLERYSHFLKQDNRIAVKKTNEHSRKAEMAREKLLIEVITYLENKQLNTTKAQKDLEEIQKYL